MNTVTVPVDLVNELIEWFEDLSQDVIDGIPIFDKLKQLTNENTKTVPSSPTYTVRDGE